MAMQARVARREVAPSYCRRVLIAVPPGGFGAQLAIMAAWLDETCGHDGWMAAAGGTGSVLNDALAFYFVEPEQADRFIRRFCCAYRAASRAPDRSALS